MKFKKEKYLKELFNMKIYVYRYNYFFCCVFNGILNYILILIKLRIYFFFILEFLRKRFCIEVIVFIVIRIEILKREDKFSVLNKII